MSLLKRTRFLLRRYKITPKKRLGQNFMVDPSVFRCITDHALLDQDDTVLDVGAGLGFLTRFLANKCKCVLAVESDSKLVRLLREQLSDVPNIKVIDGDVLEVQLSQFNKVISIPPYHISSPLFLWLFRRNFERAVLIVQREFGNRLASSVGSEGYGWITVVAYYHVEFELLGKVPRSAFYPPPEVDSIIIRLEPKRPQPFTLKNEMLFAKLAQTLFTRRNRKVRNAVLPFLKSHQATTAKELAMLPDSLPFSDSRVRELAPEDFGTLANALAE